MYRQLIRFLLPLALTVIVLHLSGQVLNAGMARMPRATETLASYGLAWSLVAFLFGPMIQARQLGLVLVDNRQAYKTVQAFVWGCGLLLSGIVATLALTPLGVWVIDDLHGLDQALSLVAREALFWLIPVPLLIGLIRFYSGMLIRIQRTDIVSLATLSNIGVSIVAVFTLLPLPFIAQKPIWLPILVIYAGLMVELCVAWWGYQRDVRAVLKESEGEEGLSLPYVLHFFWPLALIMSIRGFSRPLINLFISWGANGAEALAVLTVVYSLAYVFYGWLNEMRSLAPAFKAQDPDLSHTFGFALTAGTFSFGMMVLAFWTPVREYILQSLLGLEAHLAALSRMPLMLFSFFPLTVMLRAYFYGIALVEHRTQAMAPSAPVRIVTIFITLLILPTFHIEGATRGIIALLCGFVAETGIIWWVIREGTDTPISRRAYR